MEAGKYAIHSSFIRTIVLCRTESQLVSMTSLMNLSASANYSAILTYRLHNNLIV